MASVEIDVRVQPRSSRNHVQVQSDGSLKVWLTAPPVDGEANAALVELLSKVSKLPKSSIDIVSGQTSRNKRVRISGVLLEQLHALLPQPPLPE